jgi:pSer/pThr/pTyr-binding forkhead associated (FHA) protein
MFKLVIQDDEGKTTVVPLIRDEITIGRKEGNTIRLTERNVSRRHARILRNNGEVQIEDLGSYNGIRVNNARIAERVSLRISDQVQIGDYKLYLKAEGVEQVDDARTMPIERIDHALPTEVMAAVTAPVPPMAAPAAPAIPATPAPNRSPVAVADTDPAGRPVATAAQVAAMNAPVGYGKLVVVSSNYAGKEFDLTRPQMIVGRTDENDIVINHRSISRNHAKITRDPETGRYTISDLQSANGVRVNGQDYGKVELRRGDTVDLGHVRLRFVEPGEDFLFSRDAVITDVPESGGKKGLLVAVLLGVVVLGGAGAYFVLQGDKKGTTNGQLAGQGSDHVAIKDPKPDPEDPNQPGTGSGDVPDVTDPGGTQAVTPTPDDERGRLTVECQELKVEKKWGELTTCAGKLAALDAQAGAAFKKTAAMELQNDIRVGKINDAVRDNNLVRARKELEKVEADSVYRQTAEGLVADAEKKLISEYADRAADLKKARKCNDLDKLIQQARAQGPAVASAVAAYKCEPVAVAALDCSSRLENPRDAKCKAQFCANNKDDGRCGGGATAQPPPGCDAEALKNKGMDNVNMGQHAAALVQFEASLRCKNEAHTVQLAFMAACNASNSAKAKVYYARLSAAQQQRLAVMCVRNKVAYE